MTFVQKHRALVDLVEGKGNASPDVTPMTTSGKEILRGARSCCAPEHKTLETLSSDLPRKLSECEGGDLGSTRLQRAQ